jgi:hypothetical protein
MKRLVLIISVAAILTLSWFVLLKYESTRKKAEVLERAVPEDIRAMLKNAQTFFILSLDPNPPEREYRVDQDRSDLFHGYVIRERRNVPKGAERKRLLEALYRSIEDSDGGFDLCFRPRHALSIQFGARTTDILVCFECRLIRVYSPEVREIVIAAKEQPVFDSALHERKE